jgi:hypothetical protein
MRFPRQAGKGTESKPEDDGGVQLNFKNSRIVRKSSAKAIAGARFSNRLPKGGCIQRHQKLGRPFHHDEQTLGR